MGSCPEVFACLEVHPSLYQAGPWDAAHYGSETFQFVNLKFGHSILYIDM
jgi:hypothetical protein